MKKNKSSIDKRSVRKVISCLRPHMVWFIISLLLAVASVAATLYIPILIGDAIDKIPEMGKVDFEAVLAILIKIGICIAIGALAQWLMNVCNNKITYEVVKDIRDEAFQKLQKPLLYRLSTDITVCGTFFLRNLVNFINKDNSLFCLFDIITGCL